MSWHWGPTVQVSDDGGRTWTEEEQRAIAFDKDDDTALKRVWQLVPDPHDDQVVWAGGEPHSLWRSDDGGEQLQPQPGPLGPPAPQGRGSRASAAAPSTPSSPTRPTRRSCSSP